MPVPGSSTPQAPGAALRARAAARLREGQELEARHELAPALAAYDDAIALLSQLPAAGDARVRRELAVSWMNRASALAKSAAREAALAAYDRALALLARPPENADATWRATTAAAWLNRSGLQQHVGDAATQADALRCSDEALAAFAELPLDGQPAYRINFAGAWLNRADLLAQLGRPAAEIRDAANRACTFAEPLAANELAAAAVALQARLVLLATIATDLTDATTLDDEILAEAGDLADEGLALFRGWETRDAGALAAPALQLVRCGAFLYANHQPQFLAEFLRENLADTTAARPATFTTRLREIAREALAAAEQRVHARWLTPADAGPLNRLLDVLDQFRALRAELDGASAAANAPAPLSP